MITPETVNFDTLTNEEAIEILQGMAASVAFLFNALDQDGDGRLSPAEIDAAPEILRSLDKDGDGELNETELERYGLHFIPGRVRFNAIVRMLDLDGEAIPENNYPRQRSTYSADTIFFGMPK